MERIVGALVGVAAAVVLLACQPSPEAQVVADYERYREALADQNLTLIKDCAASKLLARIEGDDARIRKEMADQRDRVPESYEITEVEIEGENAKMRAQGDRRGLRMSGRIKMVREDGSWKIDKDYWSVKS